MREHLAWSTHTDGCLNDLLPLPYTEATLEHVAQHVAQIQDVLGHRILIENPATYLRFAETSLAETQFLEELACRPPRFDQDHVLTTCRVFARQTKASARSKSIAGVLYP